MLQKKNTRIVFFMLSLVPSIARSTVFDNRFIPLYDRQWLLINGLPSFFATDVFFITGSKAFGANEDTIGIPEIFGPFDQGQLSNALEMLGIPTTLRTDWRGAKIPLRLEGKLQGQGFEAAWYQNITTCANRVECGFGVDWLFMRVNSTQQFLLPNQTAEKDRVDLNLGPSDIPELDQERRQMFQTMSIVQEQAHQVGFGDIDGYLRIARLWKHVMKCRKIDVGFRLGCLFPTGVRHDVNVPASIPFGGNGHWGLYGQLEGIFEVKEDIKVGFLTRLTKRLPHTQCSRIPVLNEPIIFGAEVGPLRTNPGVTFNVAPFFILENLAEGLGGSVRYVLTLHAEDELCDKRCTKGDVPVRLSQAEDFSSWASSYFTVNVFYDFGKMKAKRAFDPIISLQWEVPSMMFAPKRVAQTHKIALGVTFSY